MRISSPIGAAVIAVSLGLTAGHALAASAVQKECSQKYQAAKAGNTLNGMTYNQYYKQCAAEAKSTPAAAAPAPTTAAAPAPTPADAKAEKKAERAKEKAEKKAEKAAEKKGETATPAATPAAPAPAPAPAPTTTAATPAPSAPVATGNAVVPTAISAEVSKESAGKARMHTCLAQYKANKDTNGNGGMKWIEKGGGYYSECNKKLKG